MCNARISRKLHGTKKQTTIQDEQEKKIEHITHQIKTKVQIHMQTFIKAGYI